MQGLQLLLSEPSDTTLDFRLSGEIDMATVTPLREATRTAIASKQYSCLVFDLTHVTFMDSTGLHVLADAHRRMMRDGGTTKVVCASDNLRKVFELTALDRVLTIVSERAEAVEVAA